MLWATGTGAEVMRPMAAPVLGGILVSDEVVDLLLPVLFFHLRKWRWKRIHGNAEMQPHTATAPVGPSFASLSRTVTA
jgi:copper/silver efflux system protein